MGREREEKVVGGGEVTEVERVLGVGGAVREGCWWRWGEREGKGWSVGWLVRWGVRRGETGWLIVGAGEDDWRPMEEGRVDTARSRASWGLVETKGKEQWWGGGGMMETRESVEE